MPWLRSHMYDKMTEYQKEEFWENLNLAMKWRGWDSKKHNHASDFIQYVEEQTRKFGFEIEEYT